MAIATLSGDWERVTVGDYTVVNNVWGAGNLVNGVDYTQTVTYDTTNLTNGLTISFDWPDQEQFRVYGYPGLKAGWEPWDARGGQTMLARAADLKDFVVAFDADLSGATDQFNLAMNVWLTSTPFGQSESITTELLITLHEPNMVSGPDAPRFVDPVTGYSARYFVNDNMHSPTQMIRFVGIEAEADFLSGGFDLGLLITTLQQRGIIGADDYVSGFELGSEVLGGGAGQTVINSLTHRFAAYAVTEGADVLTGLARADAIRGAGGDDRIRGLAGNDTLRGEAGNDTLIGDDGADALSGRAGNDVLSGGAGADRLAGFGDNDRLAGGAGADRLSGGTGNDVLSGGADADVFVFGRVGAGIARETDRITDFARGIDRLDMTAFRDADGDALQFLGNAAFAGTGQGQLRAVVMGTSAQVQVDADGNGVAELVVTLTGVAPPMQTDMLL